MGPLQDTSTETLLVQFSRTRDPRLRAAIITRSEGLVRLVAGKFARPGTPQEDLVQTAWVGIINAVDRFNPSHGTRFSSYAVACMVGELKRYFRDKTWGLRLPRGLNELALSLPRVQESLAARLQRPPTVAEVAQALNTGEEEVLEAMEASRAYQPESLDHPHDPAAGRVESLTLAETIGCWDTRLEALVDRVRIEEALRSLDRRSREILRLRYFLGCTQDEVAGELGLSQMHVSRLERSALIALRRLLRPAPEPGS